MTRAQPVTDSPEGGHHDGHDGVEVPTDIRGVRRLRLRDGASVLVRPIRMHDAAGLARAYGKLSEQSRWRRFLSIGTADLQPAELRRLTAVDHRDHEALVAVDTESGDLLGSARYARLPDRHGDAELAVEVIDEWQRRGVGRGLLEVLSTLAHNNGIQRFVAVVSVENMPVHCALQRAGATGYRSGSEVEYLLDVDLLLQPASTGLGDAATSKWAA